MEQLQGAIDVVNAYPGADDFATEMTIASLLTHINELRDDAILALARIVAEKQRLLILAYETDFRYIMSFDEWLADLPVDQRRPRDPGDPLHSRWDAHHRGVDDAPRTGWHHLKGCYCPYCKDA